MARLDGEAKITIRVQDLDIRGYADRMNSMIREYGAFVFTDGYRLMGVDPGRLQEDLDMSGLSAIDANLDTYVARPIR